MDDRKARDNDAYDELLRSFSSTGSKDTSDEVRNHGEIYFSMNSRAGNRTGNTQQSPSVRRQPQRTTQTRPTANSRNSASARSSAAVPGRSNTGAKSVSASSFMDEKKKTSKKEKSKKKKRKNTLKNSIIAIVIVVLIFVSAFLIKIPIMGCINDVLAIDVSTDDRSVTISKDSTVDEVIDLLAEKNLINNPLFCKLFVRIMGFYDRVDAKGETKLIIYPKGEYYLNSGMGLEGMLNQIRTNGDDSNTIMLTFPEGYNIDQIVEKLDSNGVCSAESLYKVMLDDEIYSRYEFLSSISDKNLRYRALEGFLYPDTYEFYIGESPLSVLERFLNNFEDKWVDAYASRATEMGYTADEIITVASIIEKEASNSDQMPFVASVLYNRLKNSSFPKLECDSTMNYIEQNKDYLTAAGKYSEYMKVYDTYQTTGLPVGAICCPGADAIHAALYFEDTNYYFFAHDDSGKIYLAETYAQHEANNAEIDKVNAELKSE